MLKKAVAEFSLKILELTKLLYIFVVFIDFLQQQSEIGVGNHKYNKFTSEIEKASGSTNKRIAYRKYTSQEHQQTGNYASDHGNSTVINRFKSKNLIESTARAFKSKYHVEIKDAAI